MAVPWVRFGRGSDELPQKNVYKGAYKNVRQFARTLFERVEWVGGAAESKKLSDDKNVL